MEIVETHHRHKSDAPSIDPARRLLVAQPGFVVDYVALADFDVPTLVGAIRVGATRLIDNVRLDGADS